MPEEYLRFPASLSQLIQDERLSVLYTVPYTYVQLLLRGALEERNLASVNWVLFGGEVFPPKHLRALIELLPGAQFSNVYGPAEVNQCTYFNFDSLSEDVSVVPIGRAWRNTEILVVGEADEPVVSGEIGDLLVRTPTMMQGYWRRPELNAQVFFELEREGIICRFFRTGDLVRENQDGDLEFLGRKDRQVKVRGNRVELDEVEAAFLRLECVDKAAAFAVDDAGSGEKQIVLALSGSDEGITDRDLLSRASQLLPAYALPTHLWRTESLPQTATEKVNHEQLRAKWIQQRSRDELRAPT